MTEINRFIVYITYYNAINFLNDCLESIYLQNYKNYKIIIVDDASTDNSESIIDKFKKDKILSYTKNKFNIFKLGNVAKAFFDFDLQDEDILILIDGDDKLAHNNVLSQLNEIYYYKKVLLTYGSFISSDGKTNFCKQITREHFFNIRNRDFFYSHIKTFKYKLFQQILKQDPDLLCFKDKNGQFYSMTDDVAIMVPLIEIAGYEKIFYDSRIHYFYRLHNSNDFKKNPNLQNEIKLDILRKQKFKKIDFDNIVTKKKTWI